MFFPKPGILIFTQGIFFVTQTQMGSYILVFEKEAEMWLFLYRNLYVILLMST